jgi:microsomal epoxide hydrolase
MGEYDSIPTTATGNFEQFKVQIPAEKVSQLKDLVRLSPIGPVTYENQLEDRRFGISRSWLVDAKKNWETTFDW